VVAGTRGLRKALTSPQQARRIAEVLGSLWTAQTITHAIVVCRSGVYRSAYSLVILSKTTALVWLSASFLLCSAMSARADSDVGETFLTDFARPDAHVFQAARLGLEQYRDTRQFKSEWFIQIDEQKGVIETNWFPEHKGEVKLKIQIVVWGDSFRVDAWQKVGWIFPSIEKTDWSRRTERHVQDTIKKRLTSGTP